MSQAAARYAASFCGALGTLPAAEAETLLTQAHAVVRHFEESAELRGFLVSPAFSIEEKTLIVRELAVTAALAPVIVNLLLTLIEHRRIAVLPEIVAAAEELYFERQGIVEVELRTTDPLTDAELSGLRPTLTALFGDRIRLSRVVDPSLLGGMVVRHGTMLYDASLKNQLRMLKTHLIEGVRHDA